MSTKNGLFKKILMCVLAALVFSVLLAGCELKDPVKEAVYYINDNQENQYNKDRTTSEEAVNEFTDSITALRKYLDSESFVDSGYYMGVDFDIDLLDPYDKTAGNFALRIQAFLYTYPYEDEDGNPIYKYYENGNFYDTNNEEGTRTLISALEIHNEAIKKSDISIEWYNGATNEVLIGLYFDGVNSNEKNPGNILYANIQGYKRSFPDFGDTVLYQQMIRLLVHLSVEGLLQAVGLQGDAGVGTINAYLRGLVGDRYKRVVNGELVSLLFYSLTLDAISSNVNNMLRNILGVFEEKWDPMTSKFLGFKFSTVANADVKSISADLHSIISPDKEGVTNVLTNADFAFAGAVNSYNVTYDYTANVKFDYGWEYPEQLVLDMDFYKMFDYGNYEFDGTLYIPAWDGQYDAEIKTDIQQYDNSTNNVFMEFRDIANGELMIGIYYRNERSYLDITGLSYMYGWIDLEYLGFPQVYDEHIDLADVLNKFFKMINRIIVSIVDSILDPASSDKENKALYYLMQKTDMTFKTLFDALAEEEYRRQLQEMNYSATEIEELVFKKKQEALFSVNSEILQIDIELVKQMLEETGVGTFSTRQIINILDSMLPYTMDQIAIMLGIASAEIMLEKTYFKLHWDVDIQEFTVVMWTNVGVPPGEPSNMIFQLELIPVHFGEYVSIVEIDFSGYKPLEEIYTYSGTLVGNFIFSSQETVDLSKLLSATIGESSGLNTPYVLAQNAGLSFTLVYDQFVKDQFADGRWKKAGRSAFTLSVWLTGKESMIIIQLSSDDVCFDNEVYKDLPAREAELGYVWVNIQCVTKNGTQVIPKVKIREDVFMASMSAYMNNETAIEDDVSSFADNDFNLSLTSIISALCKDAYVIAAAEKLEITSSNDTLKSLFRVNGLIGNIKVDAGFQYRVKGLESIRKEYYMYEVGFLENITGNSPYDTPLHSTLPVYFYEDYRGDYDDNGEFIDIKDQGDYGDRVGGYDPLKYDFLVYRETVIVDDGTIIDAGTIYVFELGGRRTVTRQPIEGYPSTSFFNKEDQNNQDITRVKFALDDLILNPDYEGGYVAENRLVFESDGKYYYRLYDGRQRQVDDRYVEVGDDGTVYIYWLGINSVLFHESESSYYFYDRHRAFETEDGSQAHILKRESRNLLFEYDPDSIKITEDCKTQYAPRTNGSFMGEVRRYFLRLESLDAGELGAIKSLYYDSTSGYPQYYSKEDEEFVLEIYDDDGVLLEKKEMPIMLYVMEPCEPLADKVRVNVQTSSGVTELKAFNAAFDIDWQLASGDKRGFMTVTEVTVAPGMMGEITFPVRIIVTNREIDTNDYVSVYPSEDATTELVPVIDEIDVDPYDYVKAKYEYLSDTANFNPVLLHTEEQVAHGYEEAVKSFTHDYFARYVFEIAFKWQTSYLYENHVGNEYIARSYTNKTGNVLTRYNWDYDIYTLGSNKESLVSPVGGTLYLHGYFKGQLIALRVNIGKRDFSHVEFYDSDEGGNKFNPKTSEYNTARDDGDPYITGEYIANYYDKDTYYIDTQPYFIFTDGMREYRYKFDMMVVKDLQINNDGTYSGGYETEESYSLEWDSSRSRVTLVTSDGSMYREYEYVNLYEGGSFTDTDIRYSALTDQQRAKYVYVMYMGEALGYRSAEVRYEPLYSALPDGRARKRNKLSYAALGEILKPEIYLEGGEMENTGRDYASLPDSYRDFKVKALRINGQSAELADVPYFVQGPDLKAWRRVSVNYEDLLAEVELVYGSNMVESIKRARKDATVDSLDGIVFATEYGTGRAPKYKSDRTGYAMLRLTDTEDDCIKINRPFYYFYENDYEYYELYSAETEELSINYEVLTATQRATTVNVVRVKNVDEAQVVSIQRELLYSRAQGGKATRKKRLAYNELKNNLTPTNLYAAEEFTEVTNMTYAKLSEEQKSLRVWVFSEESVSFAVSGGALKAVFAFEEQPYYIEGSAGKAMKRKALSDADIDAVLANTPFDMTGYSADSVRNATTQYIMSLNALNNGLALKYKADEDGFALMRATDNENDNPKNIKYLTEEEYDLYIQKDADIRQKYFLNSDIAEQITTTGLDLNYLFRLYFTFGNQKYAINTISNKIIQPEDVDSQIIGETGFPIIELRVVVKSPQLDIAVEGTETDRITNKTFTMNRVDAGDKKALGYYKVDPLNAETFYLPDSMDVFFEYEGKFSSHLFYGLEWCVEYDAEGNPLYGCLDSKGNYVELIREELVDGIKRYKVALNMEELTEEVIFRATVRIGNKSSGYREVTVAIRVLSKDPTGVDFYVSGSADPLDTPATRADVTSGDSTVSLTYYSYFVNTFASFSLPNKLTATFSDGHTQDYVPSWKVAKPNGTMAFVPNTVVTLMTTIGTEGGVTVDIYLVVVVENDEVLNIDVNNEFINYYVTVKNDNGDVMREKLKLKDLLRYESYARTMEFYFNGASRYYIYIATNDENTPDGEIGLYDKDEANNTYVWKRSVKVYDLISGLYSRANLELLRSETEINNQKIINTNASIFDHTINMKYGASVIPVEIKSASRVKYAVRQSDGAEIMQVVIEYFDPTTNVMFTAETDENGMYTIGYGLSERKISASELSSCIIGETLAVNYSNWYVYSVNESRRDLIGNEFTAESLLAKYINYNNDTKKIELSDALGLEKGGRVVLRNPQTLEEVTMSFEEISYRMNYYYRYLRVGNKKVSINNKSISIKNLYNIMDINDMLISNADLGSVPDNKYVVSLGTGDGAYDLRAPIKFTGGYYLTIESRSVEVVNVTVYSSSGAAQYAGGYVLGNYLGSYVQAITNEGTMAERWFSYNRLASDDRITDWYVEEAPLGISGITAGSLIEVVPAAAIYNPGAARQITLSALTKEGFRLRKSVIFEVLPTSMANGFSGGNASISFAETNTLTIDDGLITVNNVYDFAYPDKTYYLGSVDYLPKTLYVSVNGRMITVNGVKWRMDGNWFGNSGTTTLGSLTYKGTAGSYIMATADILGYTDEFGETYGTTRVTVSIDIKSAEVMFLPWESDSRGNGLMTETVNNASGMSYRVYLDAYSDSTAVRRQAIKSDATGTYLELPRDLIARYGDGNTFIFPDVKYNYGTKRVTKIYFDYRGIDITAMAGSQSGELSGDTTLNERYIELVVDLGLEQKLNITFYFHNKRVGELDAVAYYTYYLDEYGDKVMYSTIQDAGELKNIGDTDTPLFIKDAEGYAKVANVLYYYETYYNESGNRVYYNAAMGEEKVKNTDIPLYKAGADGFAMKASLVFSDMAAVIAIDDVAIRNAIYAEKSSEWTDYRSDLVSKVNINRVEATLKSVIASAQEIRSTVRPLIDAIVIPDIVVGDSGATREEKISRLLLKWTENLDFIGTYAESDLPAGEAYNATQSFNYALSKLIEAATELAYADGQGRGKYVGYILNILDGSGSSASKQTAIRGQINDYFDEMVENAYNAMIRGCLEKEYMRLFIGEMNGMSSENLNNAVYYKNLVEASFDTDGIIRELYKLRDLKQAGASPEFAAGQIHAPDAFAAGFGFDVMYVNVQVGGRTVYYASLTEEEKARKVSYGTGKPLSVYREGDSGEAQVLTVFYDAVSGWDELAFALIVQALYDAYAYADSVVPTDESSARIKAVVKRLLEQRMNLETHRVGGTKYQGTTNVTYTFDMFARSLAFDTDKTTLTKKVLRAYLANAMREAMDFTVYEKTGNATDRAEWDSFVALRDDIIIFSFNTITNYEITVNAIRRSLISGTSMRNVLSNLVNAGVRNYIETVYAETQYMSTIISLQSMNGDIVNASRYVGAYTVDKFILMLKENLAMYLIEPYYMYRAVPHRVIVFFQGDEKTADESGRPFVTDITWRSNGISAVNYAGMTGILEGVIMSSVTGTTTDVRMAAQVVRRVLEDSERVITNEYIEDGLAVGKEANGERTTDRRYVMFGYEAIEADYVYYYEYDGEIDQQVLSEYKDSHPIAFTMTYAVIYGENKMLTFSGYDSSATVVYSFVNEYDGEGLLLRQILYVYNPFEFSRRKDMPNGIIIGGEMMYVKWNGFGIDPTGNVTEISDGSDKVLRGKIGGDAGETVEMLVFVAQWSYAGMYTVTENNTGIVFDAETAEGATVQRSFRYLNPLSFYFSAYTAYSPEDYFLVQFAVSIMMPSEDGAFRAKRITFEKINTSDIFIGVRVQERDEGFVRKLFYPENSRMLEYGTSDVTMTAVNKRKRYVIFWEVTTKNKVISAQLSSQKNCIVYLGNDDMGQFTLDRLRDAGDTITPTRADYGCERMSLSELCFVTVDGLTTEYSGNGSTVTFACAVTGINYVLDMLTETFVCSACGEKQDMLFGRLECSTADCPSCGHAVMFDSVTGIGECCDDICTLYNEIKDALSAQSGQAPVIISPDTYLPETGTVKLRENFVHYNEKNLTVRYLWNSSYDAVVNSLVPFIRYAYTDIEEASVRTYAKNLLMTWNRISEAERQETIGLAKAYMRIQNEYMGTNYTDEQCTLDAYALLAINERYRYARDINRLRGGGNGNVVVTVLITVEDGGEVFATTASVKVLFADYTPIAYYSKAGAKYENITGTVAKEAYANAVAANRPFLNELYISVRARYWDEDGKRSAYETDGLNSVVPYDNLEANMYKALELFSRLNADSYESVNKGDLGEQYLIHITDIEWEYDAATNRLSSRSFKIGSTRLESNLLQITLK